jgi:class 3 adenylate cyclase/predicted ATPase
MDVVVWLRSLGLGRYEAAFRDNEIDETVLPNLTAEDLKDLGVSVVGHRRKLLDAIIALRTDAGAKAPSTDVANTSSAPTISLEDRAERRQVTVMFSDLVGSTALSARMDPEDLRELISAYHKCVAETVRRFGGLVAQYLGDGVLVYFGYPEAHEDDAERAVRAGLELIAGVIALKTQAALQARVGIATGLVVVGDLMTGSGQAHERRIVGETPNLAARLQGIAEPNTVVIAEATRRLLGNLFELKDLGARDLKGVTEPVRAWVALRASTVESRFEALHPSGLTALVGRTEETELLLRRWSRVKSGEGQVVLISGEAGIGKSRLTAALLESLAPEPHTRLRYFCSPQHTDSAFYPIIGQMTRAAGLTHDDSAKAKLDKLDTLLTRSSTSVEDVALLAEMLSLPNDGRHSSLDALTAEQRRHKTLEALTCQMATLARRNPVLMIFEDVGEPLEDPLLLFSTLYFLWVPNLVAFKGDVIRELAAEILALAEKQGTTAPLMIGHRLMASSLLFTGDIAEGRTHYDQAIALYDPVEHRPLATRLGQDVRVAILSFRALSLWLLGYPEAALADLAQAVKYAREIGQAATLMYALIHTTMFVHLPCGNYTSAEPALEEVIALADAKGAPLVKALAMLNRSWILTLTGKASEAIQMFTSWIGAYRSTAATIYMPLHLSLLARANAELAQFDDAWRYMDEAMAAIETTKERWFEAEVNRIAGQITLLSPNPNAAKAQAYFESALQTAQQQQAKSWELRAAMSMARLWSDQGKRQEARELLAPVYDWFTEGFDTRDIKEAKALVDMLSS